MWHNYVSHQDYSNVEEEIVVWLYFKKEPSGLIDCLGEKKGRSDSCSVMKPKFGTAAISNTVFLSSEMLKSNRWGNLRVRIGNLI